MSEATTVAISRRSLEAQATDGLRERIVSGAFAPGERIVETPLAEACGLSRGTIRAALRRLVEEGLVRQVPYAGYRVVDFSDHDLWELYTLRASLEALGARLAADGITPEGATRLRETFEALMGAARADDHEHTSRLDHELHQVIVRLSGNERLVQHYARVENQFRAYVALSNRAVDAHAIGESHRELVEAICAGDGERAARLAERNVMPLAEQGAPAG